MRKRIGKRKNNVVTIIFDKTMQLFVMTTFNPNMSHGDKSVWNGCFKYKLEARSFTFKSCKV